MTEDSKSQDRSSIFGISILSEPPICSICDRHVQKTSIGRKPVHLGVECCSNCFEAWYEGCSNKDSVKAYVLQKYGELGGEGVGWPKNELPRLRVKSKKQQEIIDALVKKLEEVKNAFDGINKS